MSEQKHPQRIELPTKKGQKEQVSFKLENDEEVQIKAGFSRLVGPRGIKPTLLKFMRIFTEHGGDVAIGRFGDLGGRETFVREATANMSGVAPEADGWVTIRIPKEHADWYEMLRQILEGGISDYAQGIAINLEWARLCASRVHVYKRDSIHARFL